jgi:hypothetical protein
VLAVVSNEPAAADHCDSITDGQERALCNRTPHSTPDLEAQNACRERGGIYRDGKCMPTFADMQGGSYIATQVSGKVLDHQLYYYAIACGANVDIDKLPENELQAWEWYYTGNSFRDSIVGLGDWVGGLYDKIPKVGGILKHQAGIYLLANELRGEGAARGDMYKVSVAACEEGRWLQEAYGRYGLTDPYDTFCSHDFAYSRHGGGLGKGGTKQQCLDSRGQGDFDASGSKSEQAAAVQKVLDATPKGQERKGLTPPEEFVRQYRTFVQGCNPTFVRDYEPRGGAEGDKKAFKVPVVTQNALLGHVYATTDKTDENTELILVATRSGGYQKTTCGKAAAEARKHADAYRKWLERNEGAAGGTVGSNEETDSEATSCAVDGVGWIVCSVASFMAMITDGMYELVIAHMLRVPPLSTDVGSDDNGTYNAWAMIRTFANALFVIAFLIIIYSHMTGAGLSNYSVKKMLPRLVLAVLLVNVSYWICAIAVDISNILGAGIYDELQSIRNQLNVGGISGWGTVTALLLSAGAIGGVVFGITLAAGALSPAIAMALLGILLPLLLGALLAIFIVIFILVARQALVVILIIVAPLAFVAFLLPNTQQWFTKWRQWFVSLLVLYPVVSLMVGGAQIAGLALIGTAGGSLSSALTDAITIMSGLFVMVAPFFFLPWMIRRFGGAGIDRLAGNIRSSGGKLIAPAGRFGRKMGGQTMGRQWQSMKAGNVPVTRGRGRIGRLRSRVAERATGAAQTYGQAEARRKMESEHYADAQQDAVLERLSSDEAYRTAAAGGDAAAAERLAGRADAQVHERRKKDAAGMLRNLSRDQRIQLAHGDAVTHNGRVITPDAPLQEAAIQDVAPTLDSREALDLTDRVGGSTGTDANVRRALVGAVQGKSPQLTGSQLSHVENGTFNRSAAIQAGLTGGKFDAEWMASKAKAADIDEIATHINGVTDPQTKAQLQGIVDDAVNRLDRTNTLSAKVAKGTDVDQALSRIASGRGGSGSGGGETVISLK